MTTATVSKAITEPGIYRDLSFADYYAIPAMSHSVLEGFVPPSTPAHGRERMLNPRESTAALDLGHGFHVCLLEPARFELEYVAAPKFDRRTRVGKLGWAEWQEANRGKSLLSQDEIDQYQRMRDSVLAHPTARELLTGPGANELSIVWKDEPTGLLCKGRLDRVGTLGGWGWIIDVKSTEDASERAFQRSIARYGYGRQASHYRAGLNALRPQPRRVAFIAVEKDRPYCVAVYELDERALEQGDRENRQALDVYATCLEANNYPGFDSGMGLLDLPAWAVDQLD